MKILTLNGGGTSGYMTACFLELLEAEIGPLHENFDLVAGVSTGSIIAGAIGLGIPMTRVVQLYQFMIPEIFKRSWIPWKPIYKSDVLKLCLDDIFGNIKFSQTRTHVMVHAVQISSVIQTKFWKSWDTDSTLMIDAIMASCSAPVYFAPYTTGGEVFVDGAMSINNPTMCALADAIKMNNGLVNNIDIVNVQCGSQFGWKKSVAEKFRSIFQWYNKIVDTILVAGDETAEYQAHQLIGFNNHSITPSNSLPLDSKDFATMRKMANEMWAKHKQDLTSRWKQ